MQRQRGGGNNPSCGCDMQAGWPSAAELPRGGIQGGGSWNFNEFNLALTKNGKTRHLRGKWNKNNGNMKSNNNNTNTKKNNNNKNNNNKKNNNNSNNNKKNNNSRRITSAPPNLDKLMYEGKVYETNRETGDTYENGEYVGKYVRPNSGKPYLERNTQANNYGPRTPNYGPQTPNYGPRTPNYGPRTPNYGPQTPKTPNFPPASPKTPNLPPNMNNNNYNNTNEGSSEEYNTDSLNNSKTPKTLSMDGGRRRTRKHGKGCPCLLCTFKKLKWAGGRR